MPAVPDPTRWWAPHLPEAVAFDPAQLAAGLTLPKAWAARWASSPTGPALLLGAGEPGQVVCNEELEARTRRAAVRLAAAGLGPGERLVWTAVPSLDSLVCCLAGLRAGAVVVPVNPALTERELAHVVADVRPVVAVVQRPEQVAWVAAGKPSVRVLTDSLGAADGGPDPSGAAPVDLDAASPDDPALIVYTSGTTGAPKGAVLTHGGLLAGLRTLELAWRWSAEDRLVLALPLFHVHGLCAGLFGALLAGASAVVLERFSPDAVVDAAAAEAASLFFGVPTMYHRLAVSGRARELSSLRLCVSGSAALPAALWEELAQRSGLCVLERYGMTETMLTVSNPYEGERRPGTVGFPLPGVQLRIDAEGSDGGQLFVRGPTVFPGYWERPAANEAAFADGWFATGDAVGVDDEGYVSIRGRRADVVISGGFNVYPAEVEDVLLAHPAVAEVAVAGEPSDEWGETVVAWVVPAERPLVLEDLERMASERLAPYKRPRRYRVVDALPRNALGKLQRHLLGS